MSSPRKSGSSSFGTGSPELKFALRPSNSFSDLFRPYSGVVPKQDFDAADRTLSLFLSTAQPEQLEPEPLGHAVLVRVVLLVQVLLLEPAEVLDWE